jgi:lipase (class 3)
MSIVPSDTSLVLLQADSYAAAPQGQVFDAGPDRAVLRRYPGCVVVTIRGTVNQAGWYSDFQITPKVPRTHPTLGVCEDGFLTGAEALYAVVNPALGTDPPTPLIVQGHSRGAGIAPILAMMLGASRCVAWEKPWCNGPQLRDMIEASGMNGVEYWHGDDPVPLVPAVSWLVMANFPITHFGHWTANPFDSHAIAGIVADVQAGALA